jgi:hypothetical protein
MITLSLDLEIDKRIIFERIINKVLEFGLDTTASRWMLVAGCYEIGNGLSGSVKDHEFLEWLSDSYSMKNLAPCSYFQNCHGGTKENHEVSVRAAGRRGQDSNLKLSEFESGVLTTEPQR